MFWVAVGREQPYIQYYTETYRAMWPVSERHFPVWPCWRSCGGTRGDVAALVRDYDCVLGWLFGPYCAARGQLNDFPRS